jgi:hypothetical protein
LQVSKYLDFKVGEVWEEISDELDHEGIRPVSPDMECIHTAKHVIVEKSQAVRARQLELLRKKYEVCVIILTCIYHTLKKETSD